MALDWGPLEDDSGGTQLGVYGGLSQTVKWTGQGLKGEERAQKLFLKTRNLLFPVPGL